MIFAFQYSHDFVTTLKELVKHDSVSNGELALEIIARHGDFSGSAVENFITSHGLSFHAWLANKRPKIGS